MDSRVFIPAPILVTSSLIRPSINRFGVERLRKMYKSSAVSILKQQRITSQVKMPTKRYVPAGMKAI